ncbi:phosphoribosylamine--glycine ligase [Sphaerochaeta sp. PS]|uniref:phosphoribosylamine--glycine ligase n=1 Tax=Sphaerochaeta sp. PS TaxID=3076336 RepID=UPI0028A2EB06|nr:phosphoribosylamine--glycine ligase [Sphaerochaeta sp. PS]MDT4761333.1 phosphoribosylamine--glycine ligase [Sphaerochaeta sp. PS]
MDILVIGSGGREHAILVGLRKSPRVGRLYALPGNGGMAGLATLVPIGVKELDRIVQFAKLVKVAFVVVGPDDPLVLGLVDMLEAEGIACFGPNRRAAIIEGSKIFSKGLMKRHGIPSAAYEAFSEVGQALSYAETCPLPAVVKADGLALGKGVVIATTREALVGAIRSMMVDRVFGTSGESIVIEEFLSGIEVSVLSFTDGKTLVPMLSSMDHKRAFDGDLGPNTGGMGVIAPNPYYSQEMEGLCMQTIFLPTLRAMQEEGRPFKGCLYFGLMLTSGGPKVIEYNCRFGDPELQAILPLLDSDLLSTMLAVSQGRLADIDVTFSQGASCCVVLASGGYPASYETGKAVTIGELGQGVTCLHAGTRLVPGGLVTNGGRVLNLVATADTLAEAVAKAYGAVGSVSFAGMHYRKDIGKLALEA